MLSQVFLWLTVFCLPFQLGIHFWPQFTYVSGFRLDYLSPTLYLTDIFILIYLSLNLRLISNTIFKYRSYLIIYSLFVLLNILTSSSFPLSIYSWSRFTFYFLLFISIFSQPKLLFHIRTPLFLSTLLILFLQFLQLFHQGSLGGLFYYLGERHFNLSTPNVAKLTINNFYLLRPYSTFSHPNSLAGYLLLVFFIFTIPSFTSGFSRKYLTYFQLLIIIGIFFTSSKIAILTILLYPLICHRPKLFIFLSLIVSFLPLFHPIISPLLAKIFFLDYKAITISIESSSLFSRLYLGSFTSLLLSNHWFLGVGLNHYLPTVASYISPSNLSPFTLQPIHSLPLLIFSELGVLGLSLVVFFLFQIYKHLFPQKTNLLKLISLLLFTGSVDHYWWTLPQNKLIFIFAFILSMQPFVIPKTKNNNRVSK